MSGIYETYGQIRKSDQYIRSCQKLIIKHPEINAGYMSYQIIANKTEPSCN